MKKIIIGIALFFAAIIGYQKYNNYQLQKEYEKWKQDHMTYEKVEEIMKKERENEEIMYTHANLQDYGLALTKEDHSIHCYRVSEDGIINQKDYPFDQPFDFIPIKDDVDDIYVINEYYQGIYQGIQFVLNINSEIHIMRIYFNPTLDQFVDQDIYIGKDGQYDEEYMMNLYHAYYPGGSYIKMIQVKDDPYIIGALIKNDPYSNAAVYLIRKYKVTSISMAGKMTEDSELSYQDGTVYYSFTLDDGDSYEQHKEVLDPRTYLYNW